ncbi:hypothetical protein Y1Q_0002419 [Alligator mississippiensis]|uniref:Uncharacterized protein n=1 Tax=Alligator mississippiensis TaxID=8496 RepID=A0A151N6Y3_ALLMI|nr:hypothetical protein Y1Q_0002419 [Alligator mississippiensis]
MRTHIRMCTAQEWRVGRLWNHLCISKTNFLDYKGFVKNLYINVDTNRCKIEKQHSAGNWEKTEDKKWKKLLLQPSPAECTVMDYTLDNIERAFRKSFMYLNTLIYGKDKPEITEREDHI